MSIRTSVWVAFCEFIPDCIGVTAVTSVIYMEENQKPLSLHWFADEEQEYLCGGNEPLFPKTLSEPRFLSS